jgi:hypothetical protein
MRRPKRSPIEALADFATPKNEGAIQIHGSPLHFYFSQLFRRAI